MSLILRLLALVLAALSVSCEWPAARGRVVIAGDSISWQAAQMGGDYGPAANYSQWGGRASDALPLIAADVQDPSRSPHVLVMAYGHNYYDTGMSPADVAELDALATAPADDACVVLLLPAYFGPDPVRAQVIDQYRAWAVGFMDSHPGRAITVDWATHVAAHPEYVTDDDYLHLTLEGAAPFADAVRAGVGWCLAYT